MKTIQHNDETGDILISFAVLIQPTLILLQTVLIAVFSMEAEATTTYRVVLTAVPMTVSILIAAKRRLGLFIVGYFVAIIIMLLHTIIFPINSEYIWGQGLRFFLPVVLPSLLCLLCVRSYEVFEKVLYRVSWLSALVTVFYIISFLRGAFVFSSYNMSFSYACLLPMVSLYLHKKPWDLAVVAVMYLSVLAIGSRGAALYFLLFIVMDLFQNKSKWRWIVLSMMIAFVLFLPFLGNIFESMGISSRTLNMYLNGDLTNDSGRGNIQQYFWNKLWRNPLFGIGVWGDRTLDGTAYCHNVLLEICLDFGLLLGPILLLWLTIKFIKVYFETSKRKRNQLLGYFSALILPLMTSGSYLISNELALFIGICFLVHKDNNYGIITR